MPSIVNAIKDRYPAQVQIPGFIHIDRIPTAEDNAARERGIGGRFFSKAEEMNLRLERCGAENARAVIGVDPATDLPCITFREEQRVRCCLFPDADPIPAMCWTMYDAAAGVGTAAQYSRCFVAVETLAIAQQQMAATIRDYLVTVSSSADTDTHGVEQRLKDMTQRMGRNYVEEMPVPGDAPASPEGWRFISASMGFFSGKQTTTIHKLRMSMGQNVDFKEEMAEYCRRIAGEDRYRRALEESVRSAAGADDAFEWAAVELDNDLKGRVSTALGRFSSKLEEEVEFKKLTAARVGALYQTVNELGRDLGKLMIFRTVLGDLRSAVLPRLRDAKNRAGNCISEWIYELEGFCRLRNTGIPLPKMNWTQLDGTLSAQMVIPPVSWTVSSVGDAVINTFPTRLLPGYTDKVWYSGEAVSRMLAEATQDRCVCVHGLNHDLLIAFLVREDMGGADG